MGEVLLDALLDTLKILPVLFVMNLLIELLEVRTNGMHTKRILNGGLAPLIGTAAGTVPQCGFSVVATELYSKRKIALGTLLAVYIATSDEALPILFSSMVLQPQTVYTKLLPLLLCKICFALIVGYACFGIQKVISLRSKNKAESVHSAEEHDDEEHDHDHEHNHEHVDDHEHEHDCDHDDEAVVHIHGCHRHSIDGGEPLNENATKSQRAAHVFRTYFYHPIIHTLTVTAFILAVNIVFGIIVYYVGTGRIADFMDATGYFQPVLAAVVGLIPNCAASVVLTELYLVGGLNLGGALSGLCMGAGIAYAVLIRHNRPIKNTVLVICIMFVVSVVIGLAVTPFCL